MNDTSLPMLPERFWQEVYIAAIANGCEAAQARGIAQQALTDYLKLKEKK